MINAAIQAETKHSSKPTKILQIAVKQNKPQLKLCGLFEMYIKLG